MFISTHTLVKFLALQYSPFGNENDQSMTRTRINETRKGKLHHLVMIIFVSESVSSFKKRKNLINQDTGMQHRTRLVNG